MRLFLFGALLTLCQAAPGQESPPSPSLPRVSAGTIVRHLFHSAYIGDRTVDVWLPPTYDGKEKHAVLYMHDGQMLFDSAETWNHTEWKVDEEMSGLLRREKIRKTVVVGIWNHPRRRRAEYVPEKILGELSAGLRKEMDSLFVGPPAGDDYLRFMVRELKPCIDTSFAVYTDRSNTFIAGSSRGGWISLYALCEYPEIFGGAACLSTHWIGTFTPNMEVPEAFNRYLKGHLPPPGMHRIYFDFGDHTLDSAYGPAQRLVDSTMAHHGYTPDLWMTRFFPGDEHSERSWSRRLHIPLEFLLRPPRPDRP